MVQRVILYLFTLGLILSCGKDKGSKNAKVFRYNQSEGIKSLDPAYASTQASVRAVSQIFNGLVELDQQLQIKPAIAKSWTISDDGLIYTFYLQDNLFFQDDDCFTDRLGRKVTAHDFVFSFKRILDPKIFSTGVWIFSGKVKADGDIVSPDAFSATDDFTLVIKLKQPFPPFLSFLTMPYAYVLPHEAIEKYGSEFRSNPVGTGPFKIKTWDEGNSLVLLKNPSYWEKDNTGVQLPYLDAISISFLSDKSTAFLSFLQNKYEFFSGIDENSPSMVLKEDGTLLDEYQGKFNFSKLPYLNTEYIGFNIDPAIPINKNHPLLNKKIRKALNYAIDRNGLINYVRNSLGKSGTSGFVPCALPSFNADSVKGYTFQPDSVQQLLNEAGYSGKNSLPEIIFYSIPEYRRMAEFLCKQWEEAGIKVKLELNASAAHQDLVSNSKVNFFRASWLGDYPDAESYLSLFYSKNFTPAGPNKTHFSNKIYDEIYEKALLENNPEKRNSLYYQMERILIEESPVIILYYDEVVRLTANSVSNFEANAMNMMNLKRTRVGY